MQLAEAEGLTLERDATKESGFKGVTYSKGTRKNSPKRPYVARINQPKLKHLGSFAIAEAAALAYARARAADPTVS